jgi:dihydrofolate reductase
MGRVGTGFSMSLDGFIAGPNDDVQHVFKWYSSGNTEFKFPGGMAVMVSPASAEVLKDIVQSVGALVTGRREFDITKGWAGRHPLDVPIFVVTHSPPEGWDYAGSPFTFVTEGVPSAIEQAKGVAGGKMVAVDGASIPQQAIRAGLVDEIGVDLIPVLLGQGVKFFDNVGPNPIELESTRVVEAPSITHLRFRVVK